MSEVGELAAVEAVEAEGMPRTNFKLSDGKMGVYYGREADGEPDIKIPNFGAIENYWRGQGREYRVDEWERRSGKIEEAMWNGEVVKVVGPSQIGKTEALMVVEDNPKLAVVSIRWQDLVLHRLEVYSGDERELVKGLMGSLMRAKEEGVDEDELDRMEDLSVGNFIRLLGEYKREVESEGRRLVLAFDEAQLLATRNYAKTGEIHKQLVRAGRQLGIGVADFLVEGLVMSGNKRNMVPSTFNELHKDSVRMDMGECVVRPREVG